MMGRAPYPASCGAAPARLATGINRRQPEWHSDGAKCKLVTPVALLRTRKSESLHRKGELWKRESNELTAVMAEAGEYLTTFDARNPTSREYKPPSLDSDANISTEMMNQEKRKRNEALDMSVTLQNLDRRFPGKKLKASSGKFISPAELNVLQRRSDVRDARAKLPKGKLEKRIGRRGSNEFCKESRNAIMTQPNTIDRISDGKKLLPCERFPNGKTAEPKCSYKKEQGGELKMLSSRKHGVLVNWETEQHDHFHRSKVMQALKLFKEEYDKLCQERSLNFEEGKFHKPTHVEAAERVKAKKMEVLPEKPFGHIPGVRIGDEFSFRAELVIVGLNSKYTAGIDFETLNEKQYAKSVVNSGRYDNETKENDILIYSGEGGNPETSASAPVADQKPLRGNLAMINSYKWGYPVRVIHKRKLLIDSRTSGANDKHGYVYVYDGLYKVNRFWQHRENKNCKLVFKFELQRLPGQPSSHDSNDRIRAMDFCNVVLKGKGNLKVVSGIQGRPGSQGAGKCVMDDISQGKEKIKVQVFNRLDGDRPQPFTYITNILDPTHLCQRREPLGCNCIDGCSSSVQCPCVMKNGGKIPFNEKGELLSEVSNKVVHECGPSCTCPPSCINRVSQHGLRFQLVIFKTKSMGWGVRSKDYIMPGSFICEYIGELLGEREATKRIDKDEYLFNVRNDKSKRVEFALDAAECGNVGRFINHSCDPNVVFREVVYDHDDQRIPHIMFFASKRIPPNKELTYDYKSSKIHVTDAKQQACHCGSSVCSGRM